MQKERKKTSLMASSISSNFLFLSITISIFIPLILSSSVIEDLNNLHPPPDFNSTINSNCLNNPSLRYCNSSPLMDLNEIFKSTIVASHLCNESRNPNCVESFPVVDLRNRPKIAPLYLSFNFFWKYCPLTVLQIDLSNNSLKGSFPIDILQCTQIQALDLSLNDLTGDFPVQSFSPLTNLTSLNLSYNYFTESKISDTVFFKRFNSSSFIDSGILPDHGKYRIKAVILLIGFPIFVILMVGCFGWLCFYRPDFLPKMLQNKHKFTPAMLKAATNGFSRKSLMVKSEGVDIYRGILRDGSEVRIEIYKDGTPREGRRKFVEECKILALLSHRNLVRVRGWCNNRSLRGIVTEWIEGECVEMWLLRSGPPWKHRVKVAKGVVEGMCYLQQQWPEVDYDLSISSVLLSDDFEPLISRFKVGDQSRRMKVYKFGVFLLEMIANKRVGDRVDQGEPGFIEYIRMNYPANLRKVIDETMEISENTLDQAKHAIILSLKCTEQSSGRQPNLIQIFDVITRMYESCLVLASPSLKRSHGHGEKANREHKHIQSR